VVNSNAPVVAAATEPRQASGRRHEAQLWRRGLGLAVIAFVVTVSFRSQPTPGSHGESLAIAAALIGFSGATAGVLFLAKVRPTVLLTLLLTAVLSAAVLIALQLKGAGLLGVFPAVVMAALRLPVRLSAAVAGVARSLASLSCRANMATM